MSARVHVLLIHELIKSLVSKPDKERVQVSNHSYKICAKNQPFQAGFPFFKKSTSSNFIPRQ